MSCSGTMGKIAIVPKDIKKGMMLWTLNRDCKKFTGYDDFTWLNILNSVYE